jgi:hypothetical protein
MCVGEFSSNRNNRLAGKIRVRLIFIRLIAGENLAFSVLNPDDARAVIRQQITWLQVAVSVDYEWFKQAYPAGTLGMSLSFPPVRRSRNLMRHVPYGDGLQPTGQWNGEAPISTLPHGSKRLFDGG